MASRNWFRDCKNRVKMQGRREVSENENEGDDEVAVMDGML